MVDTEIGGNADKPIVSLMLGGLTLDDLNEKLKNNPFLAVDVEKAIAPKSARERRKLVELLAKELDLPNPTLKALHPDSKSHLPTSRQTRT
jgi:hypothetical protein